MKFDFDAIKGQIKFRVGENDIHHLHEIEKMMQTPGWKILMEYHNAMRDWMIGKNEELSITNQPPEQNSRILAMTGGMRMFITLAYDFVIRGKEYLERERSKQKEEQIQMFEGVDQL
jgi:hypothetical protein